MTDTIKTFVQGDKITLNTGYLCDTGTVVKMDGDNVVWESVAGGVYSSPINQYSITIKL